MVTWCLKQTKPFCRGKWPLGGVVEVTSATVPISAKRRYRRETASAASTTILTRPVTKLCFLEIDGVADRVGPV